MTEPRPNIDLLSMSPTCPGCQHRIPQVHSRSDPTLRWARHTQKGSLTGYSGDIECEYSYRIAGCEHHFVGKSGPCSKCGANCCAICGDEIRHGTLYLEARERDEKDEDTRLLIHAPGHCLPGTF